LIGLTSKLPFLNLYIYIFFVFMNMNELVCMYVKNSLLQSWNICNLVTRHFIGQWKIVSRLFTQSRLEQLQKNTSQTKWHVFVTVLGEKLLQNNHSISSQFLLVGMSSICVIANMKHFLVMWRMRMLVNYADPHHHILWDAL